MKVIFPLCICGMLAEFKATADWQRIPENEPLPSGLHYRINLETGVKEAKLLDGSAEAVTAVASSEKDGELVPVGEVKDGNSKVLELNDVQKKSLEKINDYLKMVQREEKDLKSFDELGVEMIVDFDLMQNITRTFTSTTNVPVKLACMEELEFLVHQVDNAMDFVKLGGIDLMLDTILRADEDSVKMGAATVLSAASQGNNIVQIHMAKRKAPQILLDELSKPNNAQLKKKLLYTLSASIRNFPTAQQSFIKLNGVTVLQDLLKDHELVRNVLTLISDLVEEENFALENKDESQEAMERFSQYRRNDLISTTKAANWCTAILPGFDVESAHHTVIEAILATIKILNCPSSLYQNHLSIEQMKYEVLCKEEGIDLGEEGYFCILSERVNALLSSKDEL